MKPLLSGMREQIAQTIRNKARGGADRAFGGTAATHVLLVLNAAQPEVLNTGPGRQVYVDLT